MTEVRTGVDTVDRDVMALIARRFADMDAAARIKPERGLVRNAPRKAQGIAQAPAATERLGMPARSSPNFGSGWSTLLSPMNRKRSTAAEPA
jgi:chorismate mutase